MQAPPIIVRPRPPLKWVMGSALLMLAGSVVIYFCNPSQWGFYPRCLLHSMTGLNCPGCGSQRAVYHLLHGHPLEALRCNVLLVAVIPFLLYWLVKAATNYVANEPLPAFVFRPRWLKALIIIGLVFGILRNIPCAPFTYLAPP